MKIKKTSGRFSRPAKVKPKPRAKPVARKRVKPVAEEIPTLYERLKDFIGIADDLPPDASINHDHYLYGAKKRS